MSGKKDIPIDEQIACIERELVMRRKVYPRWVKLNKLSQANADIELQRMEAVLKTLTDLRGKEFTFELKP